MLPSEFISKACSRKKLFSSAEPISASFAPSRLQKDWVKKINKLNYKKRILENISSHKIKLPRITNQFIRVVNLYKRPVGHIAKTSNNFTESILNFIIA